MRNLDKYAAVLCEQFTHIGPCCLDLYESGCGVCELMGICHNPDRLLAFMMQDAADEQLLREPQGTV